MTRAVAVTALACFAGPAVAQADCLDKPPMQTMFDKYDGDMSLYFVAPGGNFEGRDPYVLSGRAKIVTPDHRIARAGTSSALQLTDGSAATLGSICVDTLRNHLRLLFKRTSTKGSLQVSAISPLGLVRPLATVVPAKTNAWIATGLLPLAPALGVLPGTTQNVRIQLTATGIWNVDGVSVDPYRH